MEAMTPGPQLQIDAPLLVFGGPYSNRHATEAVLAEAARLGIAPTRIICTGDLSPTRASPSPPSISCGAPASTW